MLPELLKTMMFTGVFTLGILSFLYALRWKTSFMPHLSKRARILILVVYCLLMLLLFFSASNPHARRAAALTIPLALLNGWMLIRESSAE